MKFQEEDISGKGIQATAVSITGNPYIGASMEGLGRVVLGNLKNRMYLGTIKGDAERLDLGGPSYKGSLEELMTSGIVSAYDTEMLEFLAYQADQRGKAVTEMAKEITVSMTSEVSIIAKSIRADAGMADQDFLDINVVTHATVEVPEKLKVVGFSIHFKDTSPWNANGWYWVAEPYGSINAPCLLNALYRNPDYSVSMNSRETMMSIQWYTPDPTRYGFVPPWENPPPLAGDYSHFVNISNWVWSWDPDPGYYYNEFYYTTSASGHMYLIDKGHFDHIEADVRDGYTYAKGYVGKAACHTYKDVLETPKFSTEFLKNEHYLNSGEYTPTLTGAVLNVKHAKHFEHGWYGIGMMADVIKGSSGPVMGGVTFVYHMSDGSDRTYEFDVDLWCGNYVASATNRSPYLNPGTHWIMFNPIAGAVELYEGGNDQNPFYDPVTNMADYQRAFTTALMKDGTPDLTPIKSYLAYE